MRLCLMFLFSVFFALAKSAYFRRSVWMGNEKEQDRNQMNIIFIVT